jgi:thioredoxin-related protein
MVMGQNKIKWLTWEEAIAKSKTEERKIMVDIYTEWCGWCKKMDKETLREEFIVQYVNENFYAIKFDAQHTEDIELNGKTYSYIKTGKKGYHELAEMLTKGKLSFPTIVFLDENFIVLQPVLGFQKSDRFEQIITYFAGNFFTSIPFTRYSRSYSRTNYALPAGNKR